MRIARIRDTLGSVDYLCSGTLLERMKLCGKPGCRVPQRFRMQAATDRLNAGVK